LYARISRWLTPTGLFICYDHVLGATARLTVLNVAGWQEYMERSQPKEQAAQGILSTYQEDYPLTLPQHLELLTQAGFVATDVLFKKDIFAIYMGSKIGPDG
jgi:hypothetical protein